MSTKETTYSEFLEQLDKQNVKSVEFDSYQLNYTLVKDKESYEVTYYTGRVDDPDLVQTLKEAKTKAGKGIEISAKVPDNTSTWIINILSIVIPLIFLWILFGFLMKRMSGGHDGRAYGGYVGGRTGYLIEAEQPAESDCGHEKCSFRCGCGEYHSQEP